MKIKRFLLFLVVVILFLDLSYFYPKLTGKATYEIEIVNVTKIIDGDTLVIDNNVKVRLLCTNAPEKNKQYYDEAKNKLAGLENKDAKILRDKIDADKYNRKLRYVFYRDRFINREILEEGLANLYLCDGLRHEKDLKKAQEKAREQEKGLWKKSTGECRDCVELLELNTEEEYFILKNKCDFDCELEAKDEANHFFEINLEPEEEKTIKSKGDVWNNAGDSLFLRDESGLVLYYHY